MLSNEPYLLNEFGLVANVIKNIHVLGLNIKMNIVVGVGLSSGI